MDTLEDLQKYVESKLKELSTSLHGMIMNDEDFGYYEGLVDAYTHMLAKIKEVLNS
jgi:hypothetical protein